jgi:hypothetical protein
MRVLGPDIQPTDREFILTALHAAFPNTTVTVHPRPASIATLFRVHDGAVLRHQLLVLRRVLDDARVKQTPLRSPPTTWGALRFLVVHATEPPRESAPLA